MSIATQRGDSGETSLPGGIRVSKADLRVEVYGTMDELISALGFARAICRNEQIRELTKSIQRELFKVGSAIATPPESRKPVPEITDDLVNRLTDEVHRIEAIAGVLADWSLPGGDAVSAAYDVGEVMPTTIVVDRQGRIRDRILGILEPEEFDQKVKPLLK